VISAALVSGILLMILLLVGCQRKLIYMPCGYEPTYQRDLPAGTVELTFETSSGKQTAFYVPSGGVAVATPPETLWVCFNGNAARALDWLDTVERVQTPGVGFLLVDYPGYGVSEGHPTRRSIAEASDAALLTLAQHYRMDLPDLESRTNLLAFSIGTGTGLDFAARHPVRRVILLAPFTSLIDMARRTVGWPLCHLLLDRYDNAARLNELAARNPRPTVTLFHGQADEIIPFEMGKTLAVQHPDLIVFHPIRNVDHNSLPDAIDRQLQELLKE
jgi:pimeloyl-ACP methyl ester carboxylesterase